VPDYDMEHALNGCLPTVTHFCLPVIDS
jgi:hypothetical protein